MKRAKRWGGMLGPWLLLAGACGRAQSTTLVRGDAGVDAPAAGDVLDGDEIVGDAGSTGNAGSAGNGLGMAPCGEDGVARHYFVELETQADIDALEGCHEVDGELMLRAFPGMDTTPLLSLQRVTGTLSVWGTGDNDPRALDGFSRVESVGDLSLNGLYLTDLSAFGALRTVRPGPSGPTGAAPLNPIGALTLGDCSGLPSLAGLGALEEIDELHLERLPQLTSLAGLDSLRVLGLLASTESPLESLAGLARIELGALSLGSSQVRDLSGLTLKASGGTTSSLSLIDNRVLTSLGGWQAPSDLFQVELIGNGSLGDLLGLETIESLYFLLIQHEDSLRSFVGLDGLSSLGSLNATGNPRLESLAGLQNLRKLENLALEANEAFSDLAGLPAEAEIGPLLLRGLPALRDLSGLGSVSLARLLIQDVGLTDLRGLEQATLLGGVTLLDMPALSSLAGLPLDPARGLSNLSIVGCPVFGDLGELAVLSEIESLELAGTDLLDVDALANLRAIGTLSLSENARLAQLDGLASLERLGGLQIANNPALQVLPDFSSLDAGCAQCLPSWVALSGNGALESVGPWPWLSNAALQVTDHATLVSISAPALRSASLLEIANNPSLTSLELPSLEEAGTLIVRGNPLLDDARLVSVAQGPAFVQVKITQNLAGAAQLDPCPWLGDGVCDESSGDCAPGTDRIDCQPAP